MRAGAQGFRVEPLPSLCVEGLPTASPPTRLVNSVSRSSALRGASFWLECSLHPVRSGEHPPGRAALVAGTAAPTGMRLDRHGPQPAVRGALDPYGTQPGDSRPLYE